MIFDVTSFIVGVFVGAIVGMFIMAFFVGSKDTNSDNMC